MKKTAKFMREHSKQSVLFVNFLEIVRKIKRLIKNNTILNNNVSTKYVKEFRT